LNTLLGVFQDVVDKKKRGLFNWMRLFFLWWCTCFFKIGIGTEPSVQVLGRGGIGLFVFTGVLLRSDRFGAFVLGGWCVKSDWIL